VTPPDRLGELAFDLYERYVLLERIGELFRPRDGGYQVLDVGGHTPVFWPGFPSMAGAILPNACVTVADILPNCGLRNYVQASGVQLPFRDHSFDLVCSLDTLEHIPAAKRPALLAELVRVTRGGLYLAFPYDSPGNRWAESVVREYAAVTLKAPLRALAEHQQCGLPEREPVTAMLAAEGYPWVGFEQGNTDIWLLMMLTYHTLRVAGGDFVRELNRRFNQVYAAQDWAPPGYRTGYVLSKRHSAAELAALPAALRSVDDAQTADLQAVLAFCQLFLNIAQNGRMLVDKDRHIRNLEQDVAAAEVELAAAQQQAAQLAAVTNSLEQVTRQLSSLHRALESQGAYLDARMRDLETGVVRNRREVQEIYQSRIWKTLQAIAGVWLRLAPSPRADYGPNEPIELICDYPEPDHVLPVRDRVEIRGWALAPSGIRRVLVQIDQQPVRKASYGEIRPDVADSHPQLRRAHHSGYRFVWDTTGLPEGPATVRIAAIARSGQRREVVCQVDVNRQTPPEYGLWIAHREPSAGEKSRMRAEAAAFAIQPLISIAVPVYKTPLPILTRMIDSVAGQLYENWELCLADDASKDTRLAGILEKYAARDARIRVVSLAENRGISSATNEALRLARGDYVAFLDHDDELADFALWEVVRAINANPETGLFYSDEDKLDERDRRYDPFFKPDWSPELFFSCNYICHFVVMNRGLVERLGGLDTSYSGSQDYEFLLRASALTPKIQRIPKVLYHWRALESSTARTPGAKPEASADGLRAINAHLARTAPGARAEEVAPCRYRVRYPIASDPRISILMPTGGNLKLLRAAVEDVLAKTTYKNYDILLIDNSRGPGVEEYTRSLAARSPVGYLDWRHQPFNFSRMNNQAARQTEAPYILFLNDDVTIITADWLEAMLEHAQRPEIGAVGAQLWYPDGRIQHAGVLMGVFGNTGHAFKGLPGGQAHYFDFPNLIRNCSAVTAACLLISRARFLEAGGFDESNLAVAFQDVDLCLKLIEGGYRNVYTPYARLYHYESVTKAEKIPNPMEDAYMKRRWAHYIADDPYYNPNLTRQSEDYRIKIE
jgi:GT2 family glycosyltransferase